MIAHESANIVKLQVGVDTQPPPGDAAARGAHLRQPISPSLYLDDSPGLPVSLPVPREASQ